MPMAPLLLLISLADGIGRLDHPAIAEASGIVASRRFPGIFWVHNDSGNPPALFAVRRDGSLVREYSVEVPNVDWEDIAADDSGHLFVGDIGNNGGKLPIRAIYRFDEPDPSKAADGPLKPSLSTFYRFPRTGRFDAEGLFLDAGSAVVVAKTFDQRDAELFAVPIDPAAPLLRPAEPELVGTLPGFRDPATGADLSQDGSRLAVCSTREVRVYRRDPGGQWLLEGRADLPGGQIEAVCWEGSNLILAGEDRRVHLVPESSWKPAKDGRP